MFYNKTSVSSDIMSSFFPSLYSSSSVEDVAPPTPQSTLDEGRAFPLVTRSKWNKKVVFNSDTPLLSQMEENQELKGQVSSPNRYTKLVVHNLVFTLYTDTAVPYSNSDYSVTVYLDNESKQVTFGPLGKTNTYRFTFDDASSLEKFLKDLKSKDPVDVEVFNKAKESAEEDLKKSDDRMVSMFSSMLGGPLSLAPRTAIPCTCGFC